jgi:Xaa-Pro aminopeptidase
LELRDGLEERQLDAFLSLKLVNTYYLSGFTSLDTVRPTTYTRPFAVVIDARSACLVIPELDEQAAAEMSSVDEIRGYSESPAPEAARRLTIERLREVGARRVGVEGDTITSDWSAYLAQHMPEAELVPAGDLVEQLRLRKDEAELALLREAARLSDVAMAASFAGTRVGRAELEAETEGVVALRHAASANGEASIVDAIPLILSGPHSAMPHEFTTGKPFAAGELMWHCWLVAYRGYWVENVRSGVVGTVAAEFEDAYKVLHDSLLAGQNTARPGATAGDVFRAVMGTLKGGPLPGKVITRCGHGMGLEYHEPPFVEGSDTTELAPGVVLTVEPGIWIPGFGGLTLSNTLVVGDGEPEVITRAPLDLYRVQ